MIKPAQYDLHNSYIMLYWGCFHNLENNPIAREGFECSEEENAWVF
jgi:hypothetical protein